MNHEYLSRNTAGHLRFPFIWKLQNHAFVRSISKRLLAVGEFADAAHSIEMVYSATTIRGIHYRAQDQDTNRKTINIGRAGIADDGFAFFDALEDPRTLGTSID